MACGFFGGRKEVINMPKQPLGKEGKNNEFEVYVLTGLEFSCGTNLLVLSFAKDFVSLKGFLEIIRW